jgi:hypothetical protein
LFPPSKSIHSEPSGLNRSLHGQFSLVRQSSRGREKTKRMKNNFKKMVHFRNSRSSVKYNDNDCCKERKECYCVTKEKCGCIKCLVCEKWLHKNSKILSQICVDCGRNNGSKNLEKQKKSTNK